MKVDRPCLVTRLICGRARSHETLIVPSVLSFEVPEVFLAVSLPIVIELWWQWDMLMAIDGPLPRVGLTTNQLEDRRWPTRTLSLHFGATRLRAISTILAF